MNKGHDRDAVRLTDMLEAAIKIRRFAAGHTRQSFDDDEILQLALQHLVQIVGEAAYNITAERKAMHPEIPWPLITSMRHRLVHDYSAVDLNVLWVAVTENVPQLISDLENMLDDEILS
jgi:uncharacterized protein with HEPN domain